MLRDLEQLLHQIRNADQRDYMAEAVRCYANGAYRAAVVIAVAAGMDDLRKKLSELAASGGATAAIVAARDDIDRRVSDGEAFESKLITHCRGNVDMLTTAEADKLEVVLKTRHLCAHPSGHAGSAEEARDAIATMVDIVLARPSSIGISGVNSLMDRLGSAAFFPRHTDEGVTNTVREEVAAIHQTVRTALARRLIDAIRAESAKPGANDPLPRTRSPLRVNAGAFLRGMIKHGGPTRDCAERYFGELVEDTNTTKDALAIMSAEPMIVQTLPTLVRDRCVALIRRQIGKPEARRLLLAWDAARVLTDDDRREVTSSALASLARSAPDVDALAEIGWPDLLELALEPLIDAAGTHEWSRANPAITSIQALPQAFAAVFTSERRAKYLLHLSRHSQGIYANNAAAALVKSGLGPRVDCIDALLQRASEAPNDIAATLTDWDAVMKLLVASGRGSDRVSLVTFLGQHRDAIPGAAAVLTTLAAAPDTAVAYAAGIALSAA